MPSKKPKIVADYILSHLENGPVLMLDLVKKLQKDCNRCFFGMSITEFQEEAGPEMKEQFLP